MDTARLLEKECPESDAESEDPFPKNSKDHHNQGYCGLRSIVQQKGAHFIYVFAFLFVYFIASIPFLFFALQHTATIPDHQVPAIPYSPANGVLQYTVKESVPVGPNNFVSPPSNESWKAWLDLVRPTLIRVPYEEMVTADEDPEHSVKVEGGGYMGSLGVYHELHCLRRLKLYLYKEHYYPNIDSNPTEKEYEIKHLGKQSLICAGNTALYTFQWERNSTGKPRTKTNSKRVCVDFTALETWSSGRGIGFSPMLIGPEWKKVD
ncbi:hypothetical protein MFRU_003g04990 [Monilinia fructicola]|nr:hypothetical protein MFRU_028g00110 [Monilinia fructicola]KAG4034540.1 hypothetical protein MFRU_003g04990 [Monilinia fructicola]